MYSKQEAVEASSGPQAGITAAAVQSEALAHVLAPSYSVQFPRGLYSDI